MKVPEAPIPVASERGNSENLAEYVGRYDFGGSTSSLDRRILVADGNGWVGLESVAAETGGLRVIKLADAGPAAKAGVLAGDLITAVGGASIRGVTLEAALYRISGPAYTGIEFKIIRQKRSDPFNFSFTREAVPAHSVQLRVRLANGQLSLKQ